MEEQVKHEKYESDELNELFGALCKAQGELEIATHNSKNPYFKSNYADLNAVVSASRPFLTKNGLSVIQRVMTDEGKIFLLTRLCHMSGQWMESKCPITPPKNDIQTLGSYITYLKRYNYASVVGVVAAEEDDDGEKAMTSSRAKEQIQTIRKTISKEQLEALRQELEGEEELLKNILVGYGIDKLSDLPIDKFEKTLVGVKERKNAQDNGNG